MEGRNAQTVNAESLQQTPTVHLDKTPLSTVKERARRILLYRSLVKRETENLSAGVDKRGTGKVKSEKDRRRRRAEAEADRVAVGLKLHCWLRFVGLWVSRFVG